MILLLFPFAFAIFIRTQSSVPVDWLFGRWVQSSGFATPFLLLGFAGVAGFPVVASIVAGDITPLNPACHTTRKALREHLARIRADGYAVTREETYPGVVGIAVPILTARSQPLGSIAIAAPLRQGRAAGIVGVSSPEPDCESRRGDRARDAIDCRHPREPRSPQGSGNHTVTTASGVIRLDETPSRRPNAKMPTDCVEWRRMVTCADSYE